MRSLLPSLDAATGPEETPQVLGRHRDEYNVEYAELSMALDSVSVRDNRRMSQISPGDATVSVDGTYAGTVGQFNDPTHPLNLHHLHQQFAVERLVRNLRRPCAMPAYPPQSCVSASVGKVKQKLAPREALSAAHNRPPCDSRMERLMRSPMPVPWAWP
jgi:hypothetical protein